MGTEEALYEWLTATGRLDKVREFKQASVQGGMLWKRVSEDRSLVWSEEVIKQFEEKLNWNALSWVLVEQPQNFSFNMVTSFPHRINWNALLFPTYFIYIIPDKDTIVKNEPYIDFMQLSSSQCVAWDEALVSHFEQKLDFGGLCLNPSFPWTRPLIERYSHRINWDNLSRNQGAFWSIDLLVEFADKWEWKTLSSNPALPWSLDVLERFADRWDWGSHEVIKGDRGEPDQFIPKGISANKGIRWGRIFYERLHHRLHPEIFKDNIKAWAELAAWGITSPAMTPGAVLEAGKTESDT